MCETELVKQKRCGKYALRLVGKPKSYFKETTIIDFTPIAKTKKIQKRAILPTFNKDGKHFTPAFVIPFIPLEADQVFLEEHERRVIENSTQISQILVPKPRSRQKYCGVCRSYYEEYLTHINLESHQEKLRNSLFHKYILETSQMFKQENVWQQPEFQKISSLESTCESACCSNEQDPIGGYLTL